MDEQIRLYGDNEAVLHIVEHGSSKANHIDGETTYWCRYTQLADDDMVLSP